MQNKTEIQEAIQLVKEADALIVTAGAGMGVDSGLPDFRGNEGFWKAYPPMKKIGASFIDMANPDWFESRPEVAWGFYGHRLNLYRRTEPHEGYRMLLEIGKRKPGGVFVFTSNVDGHFQKAGFNHNQIEEAHGSIHHFQCIYPCKNSIWDASQEQVDVDERTFKAAPPLPRCIHCGEVARPNILMFGDMAWLPERSSEQGHRFQQWLEDRKQAGQRIAIIEIGAGKAVPTVRMQSQQTAKNYNGSLIRINPRDADGPRGTISISTGALAGISAIYNGLPPLD